MATQNNDLLYVQRPSGPDAGEYKLTVGNLKQENDARYLRVDASAPAQSRVSGATTFTKDVTVSGKLAVKINSPTADLHVRQSADNSKAGLRLTRTNSLGTYAQYIDGSAGFNIGYANPANADATPYLTIDGPGGGNVGLGIENPQTRLHVDGDITVENVKGATSLATDADGKIIAGTATGGGGLTEAEGDARYLRVDAGAGKQVRVSGKTAFQQTVSIGGDVTNASKLYVEGDAFVSDEVRICGTNDDPLITLDTDGRGSFAAGLSVLGQHPSGAGNLDKTDATLFPMLWATGGGHLRMSARGTATVLDPAEIIIKPGVVTIQHSQLNGSVAAGRESVFRISGAFAGNFSGDWVAYEEINPDFTNISGVFTKAFPLSASLVTGTFDNTAHFAAYQSALKSIVDDSTKPDTYQGFRSRLEKTDAISNAWHFYGQGDADSYFGGFVGIGTDTPNRLLTLADPAQPQLGFKVNGQEHLRIQSVANISYIDFPNATLTFRSGIAGNVQCMKLTGANNVEMYGDLSVNGTINGVFNLRMDPDNPAAYQAVFSTDEEGNQVEEQEYIGTTENLLTIIQDLRARVATLEADHQTMMNNNNGGSY